MKSDPKRQAKVKRGSEETLESLIAAVLAAAWREESEERCDILSDCRPAPISLRSRSARSRCCWS